MRNPSHIQVDDAAYGRTGALSLCRFFFISAGEQTSKTNLVPRGRSVGERRVTLRAPHNDGHEKLSRAAGFSLVELMVAMVVGLLLLAGVGTLVVNMSAAHRELSETGRQMENGRYAMQLLNDEIHHAGFFGHFFDIAPPPPALPDPCEIDPAGLTDTIPLHIQGYDAPASPPAPLSNCLAAANHLPGTDILVLRRASTAVTPLAGLDAGEVYLQATGTNAILDLGPEPDPPPATPTRFTLKEKDGVTPADMRKYRVDIYYVSACHVPVGANCDASADDGNPIPTLKRLSLMRNPATNGTFMRSEPLVAGIENMQIDYGIDDDGDGTPDRYITGDPGITTTTDWSNVVAVEVNVLARNIEPTPGYTDAKLYDMGLAGNFDPANSGFKRHVFAAQVRVINPASRREMP